MSERDKASSGGLNIIQAYGNGGFTIAGARVSGSILVFPHRIESLAAARLEDITLDSFSEVFKHEPAIELLLIGCGDTQPFPPTDLRLGLSKAGVVADFMNTGAACRTFNVLLAEDRRVAAALIAVE